MDEKCHVRLQELKYTLIEYFKKNEYYNIFSLLDKVLNDQTNLRVETVYLEARFNKLDKERRIGFSPSSLSDEHNLLIRNLLEIINNMKAEDINTNSSVNKNNSLVFFPIIILPLTTSTKNTISIQLNININQ